MLKYVALLLVIASCSWLEPKQPHCRLLTESENDLLYEALTVAIDQSEMAANRMLHNGFNDQADAWFKERDGFIQLRTDLFRRVAVCKEELGEE